MDKPVQEHVKEKLDPRVIATVLLVGIFEFEIFTMPRKIVEVAGRDAWLSVLLGGAILSLTVYLLVSLADRFPRQNFFQYCGKVWGKPLGWLIRLLYLSFWMVFLVLLLQEFSWINTTFFLNETPMVIPKLLMAFAAALSISYGFTALARFFQLILPFMLLPLLGTFLLTLTNIEWNHFFPILEMGIVPVFKGMIYYLGMPQGLMEIILFFSLFLENPRKALKPALVGINILLLIAIVQTVGVIGVLGIENIKESAWPGIDTITVIELPGFPVERFELWLTMPWILGIFSTWALFLYLLTYGVTQVFDLKRRKQVIYAFTVLLLLATYLIPNYAWATQMRGWVTLSTLAFSYLIPAITLVLVILGGRE